MSDKPEKPTGTTVRRRVDAFVVTMACLGAIPGFISLLVLIQTSAVSLANILGSLAISLIGAAILGGGTYLLRRWIFLVFVALFIFAGYLVKDGMDGLDADEIKENVTKQNHNRVRDLIAASFTRCNAGTTTAVNLKMNATGGTTAVDCTQTVAPFLPKFLTHFEFEGFINPHNTAEKGVHSCDTPTIVGRTCLSDTPNNLIKIVTLWKKSETLTSTVSRH